MDSRADQDPEDAVHRRKMEIGCSSGFAQTFLCLLIYLVLLPPPLYAGYLKRYSTVANGGVTYTGNTLGLSKISNANNPGTLGSIGAFITTNTALKDGGYPSGTKLNGSSVVDSAGQMPFTRGKLVNSPGRTAGQIGVGETATVSLQVTIGQNPPLIITNVATVDPDGSGPAGFAYVAGSTSGLTTANPAVDGQVLRWTGTWTINPNSSVQLLFKARAGNTAGIFYNNIAASGTNFAQALTGDTAPVTVRAPLIQLLKAVDKAAGEPGKELVYLVHYRNVGNSQARNLDIADNIPAYTAYVPGSLRLGSASSTYESATPLTDARDADAGYVEGARVYFVIPAVAPDDGAPNAGTDEGKVFFKVKLN